MDIKSAFPSGQYENAGKEEEENMISLKVEGAGGKAITLARGEEEINLLVTREYCEGDSILIEYAGKPLYIWLQLDDALGKSLVYLTGNMRYMIPFGEKRINLSPKAFLGKQHLLHIKKAKEFEVKAYRNLALNVNDFHENETCFPHASANVETRGEAVFAAKNAIDGVTANECHGAWPYASWGINRNPDAKLRLDFGREVEVDRLVIYLRADFPHDNWWERAAVTFSDESSMTLSLKKTGLGQEFTFEKKKIKWLELSQLIQAKDPSPFPALTQIEVYGTEI